MIAASVFLLLAALALCVLLVYRHVVEDEEISGPAAALVVGLLAAGLGFAALDRAPAPAPAAAPVLSPAPAADGGPLGVAP